MGRRHQGFEDHTLDHVCPKWQKWCRLHFWPDWSTGFLVHRRYPAFFNILTSEHGWVQAWVHCGPGAIYPPRGFCGKPDVPVDTGSGHG